MTLIAPPSPPAGLPIQPATAKTSVALALQTPSVPTATALIMASAVAYGFVALFARSLTDAGMAPAAVALYRYLLTAIATAPFLPFLPRLGSQSDEPSDPAAPDRRRRRTATIWGLASGGLMGLGWIAYVAAVETVPVATVGLVYSTFPIFTIVGAWSMFGVAPHRRAVLGGVLVAGATALTMVSGVSGTGGWAVLIAFLAPASFGCSIAVLTERLGDLGPMERLSAVALGAVLGVLPVIIQAPAEQVIPQSGTAWLIVLGLGLGTSLIPMTLYSVAAPVIGAARSAVVGAIELPAIFLIGLIFLGESVRGVQVVAGIVIMIAVSITPSRERLSA